jgi:hypothetical protein
MTDLREVNYRNLKRQFFDSSDAKKAGRRIDSATTAAKIRALSVLLRHHNEKPISDAETCKRDEFNELLHYYSVMEIASLLDLIPKILPEELKEMAFRHLCQPSVNKYFVVNCPSVLPQLFALRVGGYVNVRCANDSPSVLEWTFPLFLQLLELDSVIHGGDEDVDTLLWCLDGGSIDGYDIDDTLDVVKSAKVFFRRLSIQPSEMTACDSSLQGLVTFLDFCQELDSFLRRRIIPDFLRYEAWHLYGYWFGNLGTKMGDHLNTAIEKVMRWKTGNRIGDQEEKKEAVSRLRGAVGRLISGEYGRLPLYPHVSYYEDLTKTELAALEKDELGPVKDYTDYSDATVEPPQGTEEEPEEGA